jgi:uncharacterized protein YajQ (UPF0234 family)
MPSFDIVNKIDAQTLENALNNARKEIGNRYDFKDSKTSLDFDKKANTLHVVTEDNMRIKAIEDILMQRMAKQGIDPKSLDLGKEEYAAGSMVKKDIKIVQGIDKDIAKKIIKAIKDAKLKVESAMMEDQVRISGKKIDDLQEVIAIVRKTDFGIPLQFVNMK